MSEDNYNQNNRDAVREDNNNNNNASFDSNNNNDNGQNRGEDKSAWEKPKKALL